MDDIREEMDVANEVFDAIGQPLNGEVIDETDLDSGFQFTTGKSNTNRTC